MTFHFRRNHLFAHLVLSIGMAVAVPPNLAPAQSDSREDRPTYEGFTQATADVLLSSDEVGRLLEVSVEVGDWVRQGQIIARLEDATQAAAVDVARIQAAMTGEIAAAEANAELQRLRLEQLRTLSQDAMAGPDELRRAEMEYRSAQARVLSATEQQELRRAELKRLELQWSRRLVRAPFDGVVAQKFLSTGATIIPSDPTVIRLVRLDQLDGVFNVPAIQIDDFGIGATVQVYLRAARRSVDASVVVVSPIIDAESGTIQVRVRIDNSDRTLRPGDRCTMRSSGPTMRSSGPTARSSGPTARSSGPSARSSMPATTQSASIPGSQRR